MPQLPIRIHIATRIHLRTLEVVAESLASESDCRGIDDGHELFDVLGQHLVEESLVSLLQLHHVGVLVQRLGVSSNWNRK